MTSRAGSPLVMLALTTLATACMSDAEYRQKSEEQQRFAISRAENASQPKLTKREQKLAAAASTVGPRSNVGERAGSDRLAKVDEPFVRMTGYVVRGTDESSFVRCGSAASVHYTRIAPEAVAQLVQRYRFRASAPLSAVYFTVDGRILRDTVQVGEHQYTSVVEIARVYPEVAGERPDCAAPRRGSLIEPRQLSVRD